METITNKYANCTNANACYFSTGPIPTLTSNHKKKQDKTFQTKIFIL